MYCKDCGKEIPDGSKFCSFCGTKVIILEQENEGSSSKETDITEETDGETEEKKNEAEGMNRETEDSKIEIEETDHETEEKQEIFNIEGEELTPAEPHLLYGEYTEEDKRDIRNAGITIIIGAILIVLAVVLFQKNDREFGDIWGTRPKHSETDLAGASEQDTSGDTGENRVNTEQSSVNDNVSQEREQESSTEEKVQTFQEGDFVTYGNYGGEAIEWVVLESSDEKILLWASKCIDVHVYNDAEFEDVSWKNCSLRQWLNNEFIKEAFNEEERKHIKKVKLNNIDCEKTKDQVFVLSAKELKEYSYAQELIATTPTSYALSQGILVNDGSFTDVGIGNAAYWVRGNHEKEPDNYADYVTFLGDINYEEATNYRNMGIRPAIWYSYRKSAGTSSSRQSEYVLENSSETYLTQQDVSGLSKKQCRLARNEIYARHGYKFKSDDLKKYFAAKSWYNAKIPSDKFPDCLLNIYEQYNVQLLLATENGKKYTGGLASGYGYEEIEDSVAEEFSGSVELDFLPELYGKWDSEHGVVSINSESFDGHPYHLLKFEYDDFDMGFAVALEVYYKNEIRILAFTMDGDSPEDGFDVNYYDENGNPWSEDGYEMEEEHYGAHAG